MRGTTDKGRPSGVRALGWPGAALTAASLVMLGVNATRDWPGPGFNAELLSALGLGLGGVVGAVHLWLRPRFPRMAAAGLVAVVLSQVSFHAVLWTGWTTHTTPWRVWWIAMVLSVHLAHLGLLRLARRPGPGPDPLADVAIWTAVPAAVLLAGLALRPDLLGELPTVVRILWATPATATVAASLAVVVRSALAGPRRRALSPAWRRSLLVVSHLVVLLVGLYLGQSRLGGAERGDALPSALAHLEPDQVETLLTEDLERLRTVVSGVAAVEAEMAAARERTRAREAADGRDYLLPTEDDELRWQFLTWLSYRTALLRLVTTYSGFGAVRDPRLQARCFMLGYAAAATVYRAGSDLVYAYGDRPSERRKLNEAEPGWGLPAGMFDRVDEGVSADRHAELCEEMAAYYDRQRARWQGWDLWSREDFAWLDGQIRGSLDRLRDRRVDRNRRWVERLVERVRADAYTPVYAVQSVVAEWIGDVRVVDRPPLVDAEAIADLAPRLEPGDILLERRSWYASNAFLPGFWPHAALYVGTMDDLAALGVADAPEVLACRDRFTAPAPEGHQYRVIEALAEGVVFTTLEHSLAADYVAVLRPRLTREEIGRAVVRAFRHHGKPYDFEFDFHTADRLVCTELVYRSFRDLLHFELQRVAGRDTLPAIEIVRKFARERGTPTQELDLVAFLDGDPAGGRAVPAGVDAFVASADRRREFNE